MTRSALLLAFVIGVSACVEPEPTEPPDVLERTYDGELLFDDMAMLDVDASTLRSGENPCHGPMLAEVTGVIDGDTFDFEGFQSGSGGRLRIIGVDAPEVGWGGDSSECYGPEAKGFTQQLLGHLVWLTFDRTCRDSYDRVLGYVHLGGGEADMFERQLLRRGLATVHTFSDTDTWSGLFEQDEEEAQVTETGLWSACR